LEYLHERGVPNVSYRTLRYKGHAEQIKLLQRLGFFQPNMSIVNKEKLREVLTRQWDDDFVLLYVEGGGHGIKYSLTLYHPSRNNSDIFTSMQATTGFSAAISAYGLAIKAVTPGVRTPHEGLATYFYFEELKKRGFSVKENFSKWI